MKQVYLTRQYDLIPNAVLDKQITIVGAGAIGSFVALSLAKMGYSNITVYDDDMIEPENMNCQFYPIAAIETHKVTALQKLVKEFTGTDITVHAERVTANTMITGEYLICAVDSMAVRKFLFETCWATRVLIDPRMGAEYATMAVITQNDDKGIIDNYAKSLYSDSEAVQERCTAKATVYTSMMIAGQVCKAVKDTSLGEDYLRDLDWSIKHNSAIGFNNKGERK
jgi:molybdopterin/thiamine biosynthesis adenylyltransferase